MKRAKGSVLCACSHDQTAHSHYRRGSECALCDCLRWHRDRGLRRILSWLTRQRHSSPELHMSALTGTIFIG
jgi:hypothetical protein